VLKNALLIVQIQAITHFIQHNVFSANEKQENQIANRAISPEAAMALLVLLVLLGVTTLAIAVVYFVAKHYRQSKENQLVTLRAR